jgi:hypothetical protein
MLTGAQPGCGCSTVVVVVGGTVVVVVGGTVVVVVGGTLVVGAADGAVEPAAELLLAEPVPEQAASVTATATMAPVPPMRARRDRAGRATPFQKSCTGDV